MSGLQLPGLLAVEDRQWSGVLAGSVVGRRPGRSRPRAGCLRPDLRRGRGYRWHDAAGDWHDRWQIDLGAFDEGTFARLAAALRHWQPQRGAGFTVFPSKPVTSGLTLVWLSPPCRLRDRRRPGHLRHRPAAGLRVRLRHPTRASGTGRRGLPRCPRRRPAGLHRHCVLTPAAPGRPAQRPGHPRPPTPREQVLPARHAPRRRAGTALTAIWAGHGRRIPAPATEAGAGGPRPAAPWDGICSCAPVRVRSVSGQTFRGGSAATADRNCRPARG